MRSDPDYTPHYEDAYSGERFRSAEDLLRNIQAWSTPGKFAADLNMPVWINFQEADEEYPSRLSVGVLLPRKGRCNIKYVEGVTTEDTAPIRSLLLQYWAWRAETGFERYLPWKTTETEDEAQP